MFDLHVHPSALRTEPTGVGVAVAQPGLELRWFGPARTGRKIASLAAIMVASIALHGILAFGVDWLDNLVAEQKPTTEQETPVEVVDRVPGEEEPLKPESGGEQVATKEPTSEPTEDAKPDATAAQTPPAPQQNVQQPQQMPAERPPQPSPAAQPQPTPAQPEAPRPAPPAAANAPATPLRPSLAEPPRAAEVQRPAQPDGPSKAGEAPPPAAAPKPDMAGVMFLPDSFKMVATTQTPVASKEELDSYKSIVFERVIRERQFPEAARRRKASGVAVVSFVLDSAGNLAGVSLIRATGDRDLDAEAVAMVKRSAPFPKPPPGAVLTFTPLIEFGQDD